MTACSHDIAQQDRQQERKSSSALQEICRFYKQRSTSITLFPLLVSWIPDRISGRKMKIVSQIGFLAFLAGSAVEGFSPQQQSSGIVSQQSAPASRRDVFQKTVASVAGVAGGIALSGLAPVEPALASGGATAGKYT